jgi:nitrate reductase NapD
MNLSGILVIVPPQHLEASVTALDALEGVEVHITEPDTGRIVVVQEAASVGEEVDGLKRIKQLPHVVTAEMVYHYFADDNQPQESIPDNLDELAGLAHIKVPEYLND